MRVKYPVRLDKTGARVLCGTRHCGARIGLILPANSGLLGGLWLPHGWTYRRAEGFWGLGGRAVRRLRQGRRPAAERFWANYDVGDGTGWLLTFQYPESVRCYRCGLIQPIPPADLGLAPIPVPADPDTGACPRALVRQLLPSEAQRLGIHPLTLR